MTSSHRDRVDTCHESRPALSNYATFARCGDHECQCKECAPGSQHPPSPAIVSLHQIEPLGATSTLPVNSPASVTTNKITKNFYLNSTFPYRSPYQYQSSTCRVSCSRKSFNGLISTNSVSLKKCEDLIKEP